MNKDTIELERDKNHIQGYGVIPTILRDYEGEELDSIIEWSKKNPNKKVYKHRVRIAEENISKTRFYKPFNGEKGYDPIPYCDRVRYLDIYWQ